MTITLRNNFHNSEVRLRVERLPATLTRSQTTRAIRVLCGLVDCTCGAVRGPQWHGEERLSVTADTDSEGQAVWRIEEI